MPLTMWHAWIPQKRIFLSHKDSANLHRTGTTQCWSGGLNAPLLHTTSARAHSVPGWRFGRRHDAAIRLVTADRRQRNVKAHAAAFGGDPDNITIFGQSGGGSKVTTLPSAPATHRLFQQAVIKSGVMGSPLSGSNQGAAKRVAELTFQAAGGKAGRCCVL